MKRALSGLQPADEALAIYLKAITLAKYNNLSFQNISRFICEVSGVIFVIFLQFTRIHFKLQRNSTIWKNIARGMGKTSIRFLQQFSPDKNCSVC